MEKRNPNLTRGFTPTPEIHGREPVNEWNPSAKQIDKSRGRKFMMWGFTLIEMVISMGIFAVIVVVAISITIDMMNGQLRAAAIQAIQDNIRFSLELITKEMRTGSNYRLTTACGALGSEITFVNSAGETMVYYHDPITSLIMRIRGGTLCANARQFTADEVSIDKFQFILRGSAIGPSDGQAMATILLQVRSHNPKFQNQSSMNLQTTITQRLRDF